MTSSRLTPPTMAVSIEPLRIASAARSRATMEDEQAVSTRQARPAQVKRVGNAIGHDAERVARHHVHAAPPTDRRRSAPHDRPKRRRHRRRSGLPGQGGGPDARVGEGIVRHFEQMAMLRIDLLGLARTHAEGGGVEAPHIVDNTRGEGIAAADLVRQRDDRSACAGKPVGRDLGNAAAVIAQQLPEGVAVPRAREAAGITDNGYFVPTRH